MFAPEDIGQWVRPPIFERIMTPKFREDIEDLRKRMAPLQDVLTPDELWKWLREKGSLRTPTA